MKVNIYETVEVTDEQRVKIARLLDGDGAKKRQATRDEIKGFIWTRGRGWEVDLDDEVRETTGPADEPSDPVGYDTANVADDEDDLEDLI